MTDDPTQLGVMFGVVLAGTQGPIQILGTSINLLIYVHVISMIVLVPMLKIVI